MKIWVTEKTFRWRVKSRRSQIESRAKEWNTASSDSLSAELFSVDGKHRYFIKDTKDINLAKELGREVGEALKSQSKGSYKR